MCTIIVKTHANICCFQFNAIHKIVTLFCSVCFFFNSITFLNVSLLCSISYNLLTEQFYVSIFLYITCASFNGTTNKQINRLLCAQYNLSSLTCRTNTKYITRCLLVENSLFATTQKIDSRFFFCLQCSSCIGADVDVGSVVHNQSVSS